MANPRPLAVEPRLVDDTKVVMPTTCPRALTSGPPELPDDTAASVWIRSLQRPGLGGERAIERRDDAEGDRGVAIEIEGVADRQHLVAKANVVGCGERCRAQAGGIDAQQRQVSRWIGGDDRRLARLAFAVEPDMHGLGVADDVGVGDDLAVGRDDQTGADALAALTVEDELGLHRDDARRKIVGDRLDIEPRQCRSFAARPR